MLRLGVRPGETLEDAPAFDVLVGGSEANVAYAAARIGLRAAWVSALPNNSLGRRVAKTLAAGGVDTSLVQWIDGGRLGLYFVEMAAAPSVTRILYDRKGSAISLAGPDIFDWASACDTAFMHVSGITLAISESGRDVTRRAIQEARRRGATVTMDVNYRQRLWSREAAAAAIRELSPEVDVLVCTAEDARDVFGSGGDPNAALERLRSELGVETVVVTLGKAGAIASQGGKTVRREGHPVETVDRIGAGDAFVAGLIWGLIDGSLELGLERGLAMSALKMTLHGDLFRLDREHVEALLAQEGREVGR
jgi:2-dehydro-3-deoxygluconokinase